jgi:cysteine desulfurase family protein (TIGR01976 family)
MTLPTTKMNTLDLNYVRSQFPALSDDYVLMDNAGGSQACRQFINRLSEYYNKYNVQLGATYKHSAEAGKELNEVHHSLQHWIGASQPEEVICGASTTALLRILSLCISETWNEGDEIIVTNSDHEANVSPWMDLNKKGFNVKIWKVNQESMQLELDDLRALMTDKTRLVAMVHSSNVVGTINDIKKVADIVHDAGALICVDGVAYAPHRQVTVSEWDVDFYVFSTYKTYGPHQAIMYGRSEILNAIPGINHYFIQSVPYKFQPGNFNFELTYAMQGVVDYIKALGEGNLEKSYSLIADHEEVLSEKLLSYLNKLPQVKIIGHKKADKSLRVPTISFIHDSLKSSDIVNKTDTYNIGIRYGDFYARRLIEDMDLTSKDGVVRVSMVHYNTVEEVDRLIKAFETIL